MPDTSEIAIPVLTTGRLKLRPMVYADFDAYARLMASPRTKFMGGPYDKSAAWGWFCHDIAQWHLFGHGALMIDLNQGGTCVGQIAVNDGPRFPERELGWFLYEGFEGKGYATEAAAALRDWAFAELGFETLVSYIDKDNTGSIGVASRLGAVRDDEAPRSEPQTLVFRYRPPDR